MKTFSAFAKVVLFALAAPVVLGVAAGFAYSRGWLESTGSWVDALDWVAVKLLDKTGLVVEIAFAGYLAVWAFFGKLSKVYNFGKWVLIKCCVGVAVIPVFAIAASPWIPEFRPAIALASGLAFEGILLGWAWYELLPSES